MLLNYFTASTRNLHQLITCTFSYQNITMLRHPNLVDSMETLSFNIQPCCFSLGHLDHLDHLDHLHFNIRLQKR